MAQRKTTKTKSEPKVEGIDESSVHLQMNRSGPESVGVRFRRGPENWRKLSILTSKSKEHVVKDSDFEEHPLPDSERKNKGQFGQELMKLAVEQLKDEFKQIAIEGGRQGAQLVLQGKDMAELQQELKNKERKLLELKRENEKLKKDLYSQKRTAELELLVAQKEREIKILENEMKKIDEILKQNKDLKKEQATRKMKEDELLSEIKDLKGTCDRLKNQLQVKISAGNASKSEMQNLRAQIAELEGKLKERKDKKS